MKSARESRPEESRPQSEPAGRPGMKSALESRPAGESGHGESADADNAGSLRRLAVPCHDEAYRSAAVLSGRRWRRGRPCGEARSARERHCVRRFDLTFA